MNANDLNSAKNELRGLIEQNRRALDPDEVERMSSAITRALLATDAFQAARSVLAYLPLPGEVRTAAILETCPTHAKQTFVPAWRPATAQYEPVPLAPGMPLVRGIHGAPEPKDKAWTPITAIDLVLVPGVAFDLAGHRLGRGGGYYDRMLASCTGTLVGLAFECQLLPHVPTRQHDVAMHMLVTEKSVRFCPCLNHDVVMKQ